MIFFLSFFFFSISLWLIINNKYKMKRLKYLFIIPLMFFASACINAQSTNGGGKGEVIVLNKADFLTKIFNYEKNTSEWVYEGNKPCIIDFYADWCGPCKRVAPIMKELASEYKDDIIIYKIDVDNERELASFFGISSIPMILFVPMKGKPKAATGAYPKDVIVEEITQFLLAKGN
jgi:thioredoxin